MDNYISYPPPHQPATGLSCFGSPTLNAQEQRAKELREWFGPTGLDPPRPTGSQLLAPSKVEEFHRRQARCVQEANGGGSLPASSRPLSLSEMEELRRLHDRHAQEADGSGTRSVSSRPLTLSEMEELRRLQARHAQEANGSWFGPEQFPITTIGGVTDLHQGTIPTVKAENGHGNIHPESLGEHYQYLQRNPRPNAPNLAVEDYGQRQCLGTRREYLGYDSAEEAWRLERDFQQYCKQQPVVQQAAPFISYPAPSNYLSSHALLNARIRQEAEQRKFAQQKRDQQKAQLPATKPGSLYPRPSRLSGPVRTVHDDDLKRRTMSSLPFSMQPKSREAYPEACRMYHDKLARKKEEERCKAAVSVPTPEPTRTESVKHLLSSVNKALEQKVEAAELETADAECPESEARQAQSQQLQQDQNDANRAARQCGESFWYEYSANYPKAGFSRMKSQCSQKSDSASAQPPIAAPGHPKGEEDLADRIRTCLRRSRVENSRETIGYHPATDAMDKVPGDRLESPRTASGQDGPSSLKSLAVSALWNRGKCATDGPRVPLASLENASAYVSEKRASSLPNPREKETNMGRADNGKKVEKARETVTLGDDGDLEAEWEEVDDDFGDEGWSHVEGDEGASDIGSEGAFDY